MINYKSKELFINLKESDKPGPKDSDYIDFVNYERQKCIDGVNINGFHMWGSLYYTINHHKIEIDVKGLKDKVLSNALLRDNEFILHEAYNLADQEGPKGLVIGGARQIAKTDFLSSISCWHLFFHKGAELVGVFLADVDEASYIKKLELASKKVWEDLKPPSIDKDFTKGHIRFGLKEKNNEADVYSQIFLINTKGGSNFQNVSGKSPTFGFMDEIGKGKCKMTLKAMLPSMKGAYGYRNPFIMTFTSGEVEKVKDAKDIFTNPDVFDCQAFEYEEERKTGLFMHGMYMQGYKEESTLQNFLQKERGLDVTGEELAEIKMQITNKEFAATQLTTNLEKAKEGGADVYNAERMFAPTCIDDMFLVTKDNPFSHLREHLERRYTQVITEKKWITKDFSSTAKEILSTKEIITDWPLAQGQHYLRDASVAIFEPPVTNIIGKIYSIGMDPYNTIDDNNGSLCSIYVMKGETNNYKDPYRNRIVASANFRKDITRMRSVAIGLAEMYGAAQGKATILHEVADDNFTQYVATDLGKSFYLEDAFSLAKELGYKTIAQNAKGAKPNQKNQSFYMGLILAYLEEELEDDLLGLYRIDCPLLLKQLMMFDGNLTKWDSLVGFGHALMNHHKNKPLIKKEINYGIQNEVKKNPQNKLFRVTNKRLF